MLLLCPKDLSPIEFPSFQWLYLIIVCYRNVKQTHGLKTRKEEKCQTQKKQPTSKTWSVWWNIGPWTYQLSYRCKRYPLPLIVIFKKIKYKKMLSQNEWFTNISNIGEFTVTPGFYCHPNTNMTAKNLVEAKLECLNDLTCDMFYRVCNYSRFRKCNNFAKAEYQEPSLCGHILGNSTLYTWSNIYKICYFQQSIE